MRPRVKLCITKLDWLFAQCKGSVEPVGSVFLLLENPFKIWIVTPPKTLAYCDGIVRVRNV